MEENTSGENTQLVDQKLAADLEKIQLENIELRKSPWSSPTALVALGTLALSLLGNIAQYINGATAAKLAVDQFALADSKWRTERAKLEAETAILKALLEKQNSDREAMLIELDKVNKDIDTWSSALFDDKMKLMMLQGELDNYELSKRTEMADAARKNIALQVEMIKAKKEELNKNITRRGELEARLR